MMKKILIIALLLSVSKSEAWNGYDWDNGTYVEIEKGNLMREGETIDFYDYDTGYGSLDIDSIERSGSHVEIEGTDNETGETRTFEMD